MNYKIDPQSWKQDMPAFRKKTIAFYNGEITKKDYKGFSGLYGSYAQKDGKKGMLRLRMTAGRITKEKLAFTAKAIQEHKISRIHFTTCQTVQLHDLQPDTICTLAEEALSSGAEAVISPAMSCVLLFPVWNQANILMCCPMQRLPENIL